MDPAFKDVSASRGVLRFASWGSRRRCVSVEDVRACSVVALRASGRGFQSFIRVQSEQPLRLHFNTRTSFTVCDRVRGAGIEKITRGVKSEGCSLSFRVERALLTW